MKTKTTYGEMQCCKVNSTKQQKVQGDVDDDDDVFDVIERATTTFENVQPSRRKRATFG